MTSTFPALAVSSCLQPVYVSFTLFNVNEVKYIDHVICADYLSHSLKRLNSSYIFKWLLMELKDIMNK